LLQVSLLNDVGVTSDDLIYHPLTKTKPLPAAA
jgi:hypothetical protein